MNTHSLLLFATVSSIGKLGDASRILARGDDLTFPYPDVGGLAGAAGSLFGSAWWSLQGAPGPTTPTIIDQNPDPEPEPMNLNVKTSQTNCDPGSDFSATIDPNNCHPVSPQLIFTKNCASPQNGEIELLLDQMKLTDGWYASVNEACGSGAEFYGAHLSPDQVAKFEAMMAYGGVLAVEGDNELADVTEEISLGSQRDLQQVPIDASRKSRLKKRGDVILQADAKMHLRFLSYPDQLSVAEKGLPLPGYAYSSGAAGAGIVVYVIENGVNPANDEFATTGVIRDWLYSAKIAKTQSEYVQNIYWKGHGSCDVSLVAGPKYGVAKKAKVVVVKNSFTEGGILDAFQKIINDLDRRNLAGERTAGYTVVTLHGGFKKTSVETGEIKRRKLGERIQKLLKQYQVVVVIAAGPRGAGPNDASPADEGSAPMNTWPQIFALDPLYSSMITVGAVSLSTGTKFSWSKGSPGANVWAPGEAYCAYGYAGSSASVQSGTSVSAAIVAGLAATILSAEGLGDQLRQSSDIPLAVLEHMQKLSQPRDPAQPSILSIWNGLNCLMQGPDYVNGSPS